MSELKSQLEAACDDLCWRSEADYPIMVVWQADAEKQADSESDSLSAEQICQLAGCDDDTDIQRVDIEDFFQRSLTPKSWHTDEDKARISRLQHLKTLLTTALSDPQVYRCGKVEVTVLVLGYAPDGRIAGVRTTIVET